MRDESRHTQVADEIRSHGCIDCHRCRAGDEPAQAPATAFWISGTSGSGSRTPPLSAN